MLMLLGPGVPLGAGAVSLKSKTEVRKSQVESGAAEHQDTSALRDSAVDFPL